MKQKKKEVYCIWTIELGQCNTSENWEELYKILCKVQKNDDYRYRKMWIIPVSSVGKGRFRTHQQIKEDCERIEQETHELYLDAMRKADEVLNRK